MSDADDKLMDLLQYVREGRISIVEATEAFVRQLDETRESALEDAAKIADEWARDGSTEYSKMTGRSIAGRIRSLSSALGQGQGKAQKSESPSPPPQPTHEPCVACLGGSGLQTVRTDDGIDVRTCPTCGGTGRSGGER